MGWFRSAPDPSSQSSQPAPLDPGATRVSPGTRIVGRLEGATEVVLDGELEGEVRLDGALLVARNGAIRGELRARVVRIAGRVTGNVHGGERIELFAGGSVEGDLAAPRVIVHEGAFLTGKVVMHESAPAAGKPAPRGAPLRSARGGEPAKPPTEPAGSPVEDRSEVKGPAEPGRAKAVEATASAEPGDSRGGKEKEEREKGGKGTAGEVDGRS